MSLILQGSTSGSITLQEPAVAGTTVLDLPATTGTVMVSGNMPAFSAYQSSNQTLSSTTWTKLQFQTEEFDTANCFDNATNYRFTPNVAGYYQVSGGLLVNVSATSIRLNIYKNGSAFKNLALTNTSLVSGIYSSALIYLNGTTDYVELYGYLTTGQSLDAASASNIYFQAAMIRGA